MTAEDYEGEITGLQLKMEDLGKKEMTASREVYSHIAWAEKMMTIIREAKLEATTTLMSSRASYQQRQPFFTF